MSLVFPFWRWHVLLPKEVLKSVWITSCVLACTLATSWSLWMKVQWIGTWHTKATHGLSWSNVPYARLFLFVESGEYVFYMLLDCLTTCYAIYSMLPAMSLDSILYVDIMEGSYNTASFTAFIGALLNQMKPFPEPNSVIIMDNCRIHKSPDILDMITAQ